LIGYRDDFPMSLSVLIVDWLTAKTRRCRSSNEQPPANQQSSISTLTVRRSIAQRYILSLFVYPLFWLVGLAARLNCLAFDGTAALTGFLTPPARPPMSAACSLQSAEAVLARPGTRNQANSWAIVAAVHGLMGWIRPAAGAALARRFMMAGATPLCCGRACGSRNVFAGGRAPTTDFVYSFGAVWTATASSGWIFGAGAGEMALPAIPLLWP
jgi:hypothetical protein